MPVPPHLNLNPTALVTIKDALLALFGILGIVRGFPLIAKLGKFFLSRHRLITDHDFALEDAARARREALSNKVAADGWESSFHALEAEVKEIRSIVTDLREDERTAKKLFRAALFYIRDLVRAMEAKGITVPAPPVDIAQALIAFDHLADVLQGEMK